MLSLVNVGVIVMTESRLHVDKYKNCHDELFWSHQSGRGRAPCVRHEMAEEKKLQIKVAGRAESAALAWTSRSVSGTGAGTKVSFFPWTLES